MCEWVDANGVYIAINILVGVVFFMLGAIHERYS